ncbi:MAG: hypothetical protein ABI140_01920 [Jatrophihabitantaceae bacterium]
MHLHDHRRLDDLNQDLRQLAAQLRQRRSRLWAAAGGLSWQSTAAAEFATALAGLLGQLDRLAGRLDELSTALAGHARRVAARSELVASGLLSAGRAAERLVWPC